MTIYFNSNDVQVYRRRRRGNTNRYAMSVTLTVTQADIQPAGPQRTEMAGGRFGTVYEAFMDRSIEVKENDVLEDTATGKRYAVKGIVNWAGAGMLDHQELILVAQDGDT